MLMTVGGNKIDLLHEPANMKEQDFLEELERIREDLTDMGKPCSPCVYFHGRERLFTEGQFKAAVEFYLQCQEKTGKEKG